VTNVHKKLTVNLFGFRDILMLKLQDAMCSGLLIIFQLFVLQQKNIYVKLNNSFSRLYFAGDLFKLMICV